MAKKVSAAKIIEMAEMAAADSRSQSIVVGAKIIADAIDRHTAVQDRIAQVQEKQLNITMENAEKINKIIENVKKAVEDLWEEIVNSESYKKYMKDIMKDIMGKKDIMDK